MYLLSKLVRLLPHWQLLRPVIFWIWRTKILISRTQPVRSLLLLIVWRTEVLITALLLVRQVYPLKLQRFLDENADEMFHMYDDKEPLSEEAYTGRRG